MVETDEICKQIITTQVPNRGCERWKKAINFQELGKAPQHTPAGGSNLIKMSFKKNHKTFCQRKLGSSAN